MKLDANDIHNWHVAQTRAAWSHLTAEQKVAIAEAHRRHHANRNPTDAAEEARKLNERFGLKQPLHPSPQRRARDAHSGTWRT
jgi:hypothetical protein